MSERHDEQSTSFADAARTLGGLPLDPDEVAFLEEISTVSREAVDGLYAVEGIRYAEPAVIFRLEREGE